MKEMSKRAAVAALAGVMAMGMLTGCGEKKLDGTKTVATVNGTEIPMGVLSVMVRHSQAQTEAMYASFMGGSDFAIWDTEAEEGKTFGQQAVEQSLEELETMKAIEEAAAEFMKANSQETIEKLAVTEDQVKTYLELRTYEARMQEPIVADVDTEVSEEESQQSSFSYVSLSTADLEEKDAEKKKEDAQEILDTMKKDPEADFDETAKAVNEEYAALDGTFDTTAPEDEDDASSSYPTEVLEVLRSLEDGEMGPDVIETDTGYYVVRLDKKLDEEATADKKDSIIEERKSELYTDTTTSWREEAEINVDQKVLKTLTVTDNNKFTVSVPETEEMTEESAEETTEETTAEDETAEDADSEELSDEEVLVPAEEEAEAAGEEAAE